MPPRKTTRRDRPARESVPDPMTDAATAATGPETDSGPARLDDIVPADPPVAPSPAIPAGEISRERLVEMATAAYHKAMAEKGGASAAISAVKELGALTGARIERAADTSDRANLDELSDHALADIAAAGGAGTAAPPDPASEPD